MEITLPKKYLSYSQMQLWQRDKEKYRERYYLNGPSFENIETIFGKRVATLLENWKRDKDLAINSDLYRTLYRIPKYAYSEHRIELKINGVPFLGVMDYFSKRKKAIIEIKTGKQAWDNVRVNSHDQLVIYSMLSKMRYGKVDPEVRLVWIETRFKSVMDKVGTRLMEGEGRELEFTGKIEIFKRRIAEWERTRMKRLIIKVAKEISQDYTLWLQKNK